MKHAIPAILACLISVAALASSAAAADPPAISMFSFLDEFDMAANDGDIHIGEFLATNLPKPNYGQYGNDGPNLWAFIRTAGGQDIFKLGFASSVRNETYYSLSHEALDILDESFRNPYDSMQITKPGDYVLDWYADGNKFASFPFSVEARTVSNGSTYYFMDGPWSDWACFSYDNGDPESTVKFNINLRHMDSENKDYDFRVKIFNKNGGALVCMGFTTSITLRADWYFMNDSLAFPPKPGNTYGDYVHAKELLAKDGAYVAKVYLGGQLYGEYDFSISGGRFVRSGRTARGGDPLSYVEGGNDCFWYEKK